MHIAVTSFNAGELSRRLFGRSDISQYARGCQKLQNFNVTAPGALERRRGSLLIAAAKNPTTMIRLIPFVYSESVVYLCEFGDQYIRFYQDDTLIDEIVSVYTADELPLIQYIQSADIMFLTHPAHPVQQLRRTAADEFELIEMDFKFPPVLDLNLEETTITPSARDGEDISLTASAAVFESGNVGGYFELVHTRISNDIDHDFHDNGVSASIEVFGDWTLVTHGTWTGTLKIERSFDGGTTWYDYRTYTSSNDNNVSAVGTEKNENALYRLSMSDYEQSTTGTIKYCQSLFSNPDFTTTGVVKITAVADSTHATADVIKKLGNTTATKEWNEGAFSARRGFPVSLSFFGERLFLAGTANDPQRLWGSKVGAWDEFLTGENDADGLDFTLVSDAVNTIKWICGQDDLIIGTTAAEWSISADKSQALTPTNYDAKRHSAYGSGNIPAKMIGDVVLFTQRKGYKIRELVYDWQKEGYVAPDLTQLADHITDKNQIVENVVVSDPDEFLYCLMSDGSIAALMYDRGQEIVSWSRMVTAGNVISICNLPGVDYDHLYFAVNRNGKIFIEKFFNRRNSEIYVDSAVIADGEALTAVDVPHLNGMTVSVVSDGCMLPDQVVDNSQVILDSPASHVVVGLQYDSIMSPMPFETEAQDGKTLLRKKHVSMVKIAYYDSLGGTVKVAGDQPQEIASFDVLADNLDRPLVTKTGISLLSVRSGYEYSVNVEVSQSRPLPLNISAISFLYEVSE